MAIALVAGLLAPVPVLSADHLPQDGDDLVVDGSVVERRQLGNALVDCLRDADCAGHSFVSQGCCPPVEGEPDASGPGYSNFTPYPCCARYLTRERWQSRR